MLGVFEIAVLCLFGFFYVGLIYNLPVLAAGVRDLRRSRRQVKKPNSAYDESGLPRFSVILPVKNEEKVIGRLLRSLLRQNYPADKLEIVIVDDGSVDATANVCREFVEVNESVKFLQRSVCAGKASAINYGIAHCTGDIVGVFDADNLVAEDALMNAAQHFRNASVAAIQGRIHSVNSRQNMLTQFISYEDAVWSDVFLRGKDVLGLFVHLRGCCEFIRKDVLDAVGGFDEGSISEDTELSARLTDGGHRIKFAEDVKVWQESPYSLKAFLRQRTRWCRGHLEVAFKYGKLVRHPNKRTIDGEFTLFLPLFAVASMFSYMLASYAFVASLQFTEALKTLMTLSSVVTSLLFPARRLHTNLHFKTYQSEESFVAALRIRLLVHRIIPRIIQYPIDCVS